MTDATNYKCQEIIDQVQAYIKKHANPKEAALLEAFANRYFIVCSAEDLRQYAIKDLYAILFTHFQLIYQRSSHETKIRIFNPSEKKEGWYSAHTIIQISHDDIPFLVDSVRMVINRYGYQIHFIIHFGGLKVRRDRHAHLVEVLPPNLVKKDTSTEAPIYIEIDRIVDEQMMEKLK